MKLQTHAVNQPSGTSALRRWLMATLSIFAAVMMAVALASPAEAASRKVCAPKKCVKVPASKYCYPGKGCGKRVYRDARPGEYCSSSVGCVSYKGKNYFYIGGPKLTDKQQLQVQKCASSLGVTWLGAAGTGPVGLTILGAAVSLWGCT
ncbi:hypothetical protein [Streptomyces platensis]|uniref:hypothetical protein n=1 Tax=Streptomyces platensis TaxID=58346 RepID=UPI002E8187B3|nr:hypothetical protein [Streptomyces platensis]WUB81644.1 hypothetical protein OG424_22120 [Streptomyces platensis]